MVTYVALRAEHLALLEFFRYSFLFPGPYAVRYFGGRIFVMEHHPLSRAAFYTRAEFGQPLVAFLPHPGILICPLFLLIFVTHGNPFTYIGGAGNRTPVR